MSTPNEAIAPSETRERLCPGSTYRLQFHAGFRFEEALSILSYLAELGITDLYASPIFKSGEQSTHGYDVCSYREIDPKLGGDEAFNQLTSEMKSLGLKLLLDIVPNHMRADSCNDWWRNLLEDGPGSPYAHFFDVDWDSDLPQVHRKVLLPILGDLYSNVLESGQIRLALADGALWVTYGPLRFPTSATSYRELLSEALQFIAADDPEASMIHGWLDSSPVGNGGEVDVFKTHLRNLSETSELFQGSLEKALELLNGTPGVPSSFDSLDAILQKQHYRLCWWRIGPEQIDYRRFFDVTDLVCINSQRQEVFAASHQQLYRLIERGDVHGVRVDHPDGLWDPKQYLERLVELWPEEAKETRFIVVEKILSGFEQLPRSWPVAGTTGYDFLNQVNGILVDTSAKMALTESCKEFTGRRKDFGRLLFASRLKVLRQSFPGQLQSLVEGFLNLAAQTRYGRDFTLRAIRSALSNFIAAFPIYRTYVTESSTQLSPQERRAIERAWRDSRIKIPEGDLMVLDFLRSVLLLEFPADFGTSTRAQAQVFIMKLQQLTAPLAAKGLEDTTCYLFNRLTSLNEVGGNPGRFGLSVKEFHTANEERARHWPHSLLATATHDTKRGEDTRARINVISELTNEWTTALSRWKEMNQSAKTPFNGVPAPTSNDEYLFYQTLLGTWTPDSADHLKEYRGRISQYMLKAAREAKDSTSWTDQNHFYENALSDFVERVLSPEPDNRFLADFPEFARKVSFFGYLNSLAQTVLKSTAPGVPDFYQGTELWDYSLVDPDNRRPVDFPRRIAMFNALTSRCAQVPRAQLIEELLRESANGGIKMFIIWQMLQLRRREPRLFESGQYVRVGVSGSAESHVCGFARILGTQSVIAVVPRQVCKMMRAEEKLPHGVPAWSDTLLTIHSAKIGRRFREIFSDRVLTAEDAGKDTIGLRVSEVLENLPVALLSSIP